MSLVSHFTVLRGHRPYRYSSGYRVHVHINMRSVLQGIAKAFKSTRELVDVLFNRKPAKVAKTNRKFRSKHRRPRH